MTAVACTCGHERLDHLLEYVGGQAPWRRGPCNRCAGCDRFTPAGQAP